MIGIGLIALGFLSLYLGISNFRDYRRGKNAFAPTDVAGLHAIWNTVFKLRRFNAHLDVWIFLGLGPVLLVIGTAVMLGAFGD